MANTLAESGSQIVADDSWNTVYTYSSPISGLIIGLRISNNSTEGVTYRLEIGGDEIGSFLPLPSGSADEHVVNALPIILTDTQTVRLRAESDSGTANVSIKLSIVEIT